jgi:hypothetical protein
MTPDLWEEFTAAAAAVENRHFDWLERQGVPHDFLWHGAMRFGAAEIAPCNDGTYQPIESGQRAIIMPTIPVLSPAEWQEGDDIEDVGDLVAWRPEEPTRWWCRTGMLPVMNPGAVLGAEFYREPLKLWSSPLAWMRAAGEGAVILDPVANLRFWLGSVSEILADSHELGREIDRRLREPRVRLPRVMIPKRKLAA